MPSGTVASVLHLSAQTQMRFNDAIDVACGAQHSADAPSMWMGVAALAALGFAWWRRARAAAEGQQSIWAAITLLAGVSQVFFSMWLVPIGCLSGRALTSFVGYASPWFIAALLFRSALAEAPDPLRTPTGDPPRDPFA